MLAQIPVEIVGYVVGYLNFEDLRSIARVCSVFRLPAQLRLFRTIRIISDPFAQAHPDHIKSILSSPHLLRYTSRLVVESPGFMLKAPIHSLWSHLASMCRLKNMDICLEPGDCSTALSALEGLGSAKEIALAVRHGLAPDMFISDNPLPVHILVLSVYSSSYPVATRLIQKCSQSLRQLRLRLVDNSTPPLPFLPRLDEFSLEMHMLYNGNELDLMTWFPFLNRHPTITRLSLDYQFTLTVRPSPNLLPNLQFLSATPTIIERLIPGRPVTDISTITYSQPGCRFPLDTMLQPLRQPFVPVTTFEINASDPLSNDLLVNIVQALPKLRNCRLTWICHEISTALQGVLAALGRCKDMIHIHLYPTYRITPNRFGPLWSRGDFIQMVQRVQENGAVGLWSFELRTVVLGFEGCEAIRVGWLDVPQQQTLKGEWKFDIWGSSSDSDVPLSTWGASVETEIARRSC